MLRLFWVIFPFLALQHGAVAAEGLPLTAEIAEVPLTLNGESVTLRRTGTEEGEMCPPSCLIPLRASEGVATYGALEVAAFLANEGAAGRGHLMDIRMPAAFAETRLPGAVNVPLATLAPDNPFRADILLALGARKVDGALSFEGAPVLVIYGAGLKDEAAQTAVKHLLLAGYPVELVKYFRGGLQEWLFYGLTVIGADTQG
jgi:rhodanese-related sulfurtransferase